MLETKPSSRDQEDFNLFAITQAQLDAAAEVLELDPALHGVLREPLRDQLNSSDWGVELMQACDTIERELV